MATVYSTTFTAASDTPLENYGAPDWSATLNGNNLTVIAATGRVLPDVANSDIIYRLAPAVAPAVNDYTVTIRTAYAGTGGSGGYPMARVTAAGDGYDFDQENATGSYRLWRSNAGTFTQLATIPGPSVPIGPEVDLGVKVEGTNPVVLTFYVNGSQIGTYTDSSAQRISTGVPGIGLFGDGSANNYITSFSVDDVAVGVVATSTTTDASDTPLAAASVRPIQFARPNADISDGAWVATSGVDLFAMIDEASASDTDYIRTSSTSIATIGVASMQDPAASDAHYVRYRIGAANGKSMIVRLMQGAVQIASWTHSGLSAAPTTYQQTLSQVQADSITDYTALRFQFEATA